MEELQYITLNGLLDMLHKYKDIYGGNVPVLLSDGDSPNALTTLEGVYVIDMLDDNTDEKQTIVLLSNLNQDELMEESGWEFDEAEWEEL